MRLDTKRTKRLLNYCFGQVASNTQLYNRDTTRKGSRNIGSQNVNRIEITKTLNFIKRDLRKKWHEDISNA